MPPEVQIAAGLKDKALRHLARFPASAARLARVLERRAGRAVAAGELEADRAEALVAEVVQDLVCAGLVDDATYAQGRARALARRGRSRARIRQALGVDGIERSVADEAVVEAMPEENADHALAVRYARRRGLGPFRSTTARDAARERDLRALVRQGFPLPVARTVIDAESPDTLDDPLA